MEFTPEIALRAGNSTTEGEDSGVRPASSAYPPLERKTSFLSRLFSDSIGFFRRKKKAKVFERGSPASGLSGEERKDVMQEEKEAGGGTEKTFRGGTEEEEEEGEGRRFTGRSSSPSKGGSKATLSAVVGGERMSESLEGNKRRETERGGGIDGPTGVRTSDLSSEDTSGAGVPAGGEAREEGRDKATVDQKVDAPKRCFYISQDLSDEVILEQ